MVGPPAGCILEAARKADAIVMGTLGRTGLPHLLIGSVAERVVRHAPVPVLTVRAPARRRG
jgi:nucleotide-binding universal stress UspA family protein